MTCLRTSLRYKPGRILGQGRPISGCRANRSQASSSSSRYFAVWAAPHVRNVYSAMLRRSASANRVRRNLIKRQRRLGILRALRTRANESPSATPLSSPASTARRSADNRALYSRSSRSSVRRAARTTSLAFSKYPLLTRAATKRSSASVRFTLRVGMAIAVGPLILKVA